MRTKLSGVSWNMVQNVGLVSAISRPFLLAAHSMLPSWQIIKSGLYLLIIVIDYTSHIVLLLLLPVDVFAWSEAVGCRCSSCGRVRKRCTSNGRCRRDATTASKSSRNWRIPARPPARNPHLLLGKKEKIREMLVNLHTKSSGSKS